MRCSPARRRGGRDRAILASLIQSARLNGVDPFPYLADVLEHMVSGAVKANALDRLLPWTWRAERDGPGEGEESQAA